MRDQHADTKRTGLIAVLFYLVLTLAPFTASAEGPATANIILINNAALVAGQSLSVKEFQVTGDKERLVKNVALGPVEADCTNGCGTEPASHVAAPGHYRIEVRTDLSSPSLTSIAFNVKAGEEYIWMITNRNNPKASRETAPGMKILSDTGPFRLDLVTYTPAQKVEAPVASSAPVKKKNDGFWPFKPKKTLSQNR